MTYGEAQAIRPALPPNHWGEGFWKERSWVARELMEPNRHLSGGDAGNPAEKRIQLGWTWDSNAMGASEAITFPITLR